MTDPDPGGPKTLLIFYHSSISTADLVASEDPSTCTTAVETEYEEEIKEGEAAQPEGEGTAAVSIGSPAKTSGRKKSIKGQTSGVHSILLKILCAVAELSNAKFLFFSNFLRL